MTMKTKNIQRTTAGALLLGLALVAGCKAGKPGSLEGDVMKQIKQNVTIGGKDVKNPGAKEAAPSERNPGTQRSENAQPRRAAADDRRAVRRGARRGHGS